MDTVDPKPGYTTSEFWMSFAAVVVPAIATLGTLFGLNINKDHLLALVPTVAPVAAAIAAAYYAHSRAKVKQAHYQAVTALNTPAPAVVSHGTVNVQPVLSNTELTGQVS